MAGLVVTLIDSTHHPLFKEWWALYESSFPPCERRGLEMHADALRDSLFRCLHLADAGGFAGLLSYWQLEELTYVEHFAIVPERRGCGLGHAALGLVPPPVVLEIELVVDNNTARRLAFYESCSFVRLEQPHVQLAYQAGESDVSLLLLSKPLL